MNNFYVIQCIYISLLQITDYNMTPNLSSLSENLRVCLQESEEVPADFTQLFHSKVTIGAKND